MTFKDEQIRVAFGRLENSFARKFNGADDWPPIESTLKEFYEEAYEAGYEDGKRDAYENPVAPF